MTSTLFRNARIFTPLQSDRPLAGPEQGRVHVVPRGALLCTNGLIAAVGPEEEVLRKALRGELDLEVDCRGACMIPGFVDPHTHICFAARRERSSPCASRANPIWDHSGGEASFLRGGRRQRL
jgi:imidazolonepropionase